MRASRHCHVLGWSRWVDAKRPKRDGTVRHGETDFILRFLFWLKTVGYLRCQLSETRNRNRNWNRNRTWAVGLEMRGMRAHLVAFATRRDQNENRKEQNDAE